MKLPHLLPISRIRRDGPLPLAIAQESFWSLEQSIPGNSFSNVFTAFRIVGSLDVSALRWALDEIVRRHEVLRTTFSNLDGLPTQIISSIPSSYLMIDDLREWTKAEREVVCLRCLMEEALQPFDIAHGPLLRVKLIVLANQEYLLLITMHHIVSDIWSLQVLMSEMAVLYEAFNEGCHSPLPELSVQYADFAVWQRKLVQEGAMDAQLFYWKQKLSKGSLQNLNLPIDYPRPVLPSFRTSRHSVTLPKSLAVRLKEIGQEEGCTLFMTLLSVLNIALYGFTGQQDIRVATLIALRNYEQIERMIGLFINTLLIRINLDDNQTIRSVLQSIRETVLEAYDHQDLPFEVIVQELQFQGEKAPLFPVLFLFGNQAPQSLQLGDLTIQPLDLGKGLLEVTTEINTVTSFDLILNLTERTEEVSGTLVYKTELFLPSTIKKMLVHFQNVAEWVAFRPDEKLSGLPPFILS